MLRELRGAQQKLSVRSSSVERREHAGRPEQPSMNLEVEQLRSQGEVEKCSANIVDVS